MRIVKEFNLGHLKCTVFSHDGLTTLKIEDEYGAISYKLKTLQSEQIEDIEQFVELSSIKDHVIDAFRAMRRGRDSLLEMIVTDDEVEEEII